MNLKEWALLFLVVLSLTSCSKSTEVTDFEPEPLTIYTPEEADTAIITVTDQNGVCLYQYEGSMDIRTAAEGKAYITVIQNNQVTK